MKKTVLMLSLSLIVGSFTGIAQESKTWTLKECIDYSFEQNIQIRKGELTNQRLSLYAAQAEAQRLPSLNASISQNFNWSKSLTSGTSGLSGTNGSNYSVNSGVTIYNASRISNQIRQAQLDIEGGIYSLETTKQSISLNILNAFLQVLYAEEQVKNTEKQILSTESQLNLALERLGLKIISQADYLQVKSQLASQKLTLANSQSQLAIAKVSLMQMMELPVGGDFLIAEPALGESLNENRIPNVQAVYEAALAIKPQIKNAAINKENAALDEKIAKASFLPVLSASAGISSGYSSRTTDPYFDQLNNGVSPSMGFSLSIPIYQKKQAKTNVAVAKLGYMDSELSETDTKNQLRKNIEQACVDVTSAQIKYEASLEKYRSTSESTALSDEKFTQGIINSTDYLVSKTNLIVSESELLQSKFNLIFSYKILDFYMGIPLSL